MIKINLNPKKGKRKQSLKSDNTNYKKIFIVLPQIAVASISLFLYVYIDLKTNDLKQKEIQLSMEKDRLKITEDKINKLKNDIVKEEKEKDKLDARLKTFQYLADSKKLLLTKLNSIVLPTPNGLWFESIEISKDSIKITGNSLNPELIARYQQYLSIIHKNIVFNGTERKVSAHDVIFYSFSFEAKN